MQRGRAVSAFCDGSACRFGLGFRVGRRFATGLRIALGLRPATGFHPGRATALRALPTPANSKSEISERKTRKLGLRASEKRCQRAVEGACACKTPGRENRRSCRPSLLPQHSAFLIRSTPTFAKPSQNSGKAVCWGCRRCWGCRCWWGCGRGCSRRWVAGAFRVARRRDGKDGSSGSDGAHRCAGVPALRNTYEPGPLETMSTTLPPRTSCLMTVPFGTVSDACST